LLGNFKSLNKDVNQKEISELFIHETLSISILIENYEFSLCDEII
jgi:hypothetical protein